MRIVSWNVNYWMNTHIYDPEKDRYKYPPYEAQYKHPSYKNSNEEINAWINSCKKYIQELDAEIILLQEVNPFTLYGIKYDKNDQNQYQLVQDNKIIFYHELYNELFDEELKENFWGNAIIINRNSIACVENNITLKSNDYYGRNGLMSYDFVSEKGTGITIINYYNKRESNKKAYTMPNNIQNDLKNIIDRNDNIIIFAGDFNSDKERDLGNRKFFDFIEEIGFEEHTNGEEFRNTMVPEARAYPNDKIYIKNTKNVEKMSCEILKDTNIKLSDHYPILCEVLESEETTRILLSEDDVIEMTKNRRNILSCSISNKLTFFLFKK